MELSSKSVASVVFLLCSLFSSAFSSKSQELLVLTVATEETDGFLRFMRSATIYGYNVEVLGMGKKWEGGDMNYPGGGFKVNLLKEALEKYKDKDDLLIMFVDSYDVIFTAPVQNITRVFQKLKANIVFSAEDFCWPDLTLSDKYPPVKDNEKRFLNSGGFIGYAPFLWKVVSHSSISNSDDDQLYYTEIFIQEDLRKSLGLKLDTKGEIFLNLNGALSDIEIKFLDSDGFIYNRKTGVIPIVLHGNGPSFIKIEFNRIANYMNKRWSIAEGSLEFDENRISLYNLKESDYPTVYMAVFLHFGVPFIELFFKRIAELDYPKAKISLFIHNTEMYNNKFLIDFIQTYGDQYAYVKVLPAEANKTQEFARNHGIEDAIHKNCDYYFNVDGDVQITYPQTLLEIIEQNRTILAPMMHRYGKLWANWWGGVTDEGFYRRSADYVNILHRYNVGVWNVPHIGQCYLIHKSKLPQVKGLFRKTEERDADLVFTERLRNKGMFMFITNRYYFGHLSDHTDFDVTKKHPDMWMIFDNRADWETMFIHENFSKEFDPGVKTASPCQDVYWFPVMTPRFCNNLIEIMENFGKWSDGSNKDARLDGGYENVPTRDIHMNQVEYEREWLHILREFVTPMQAKVFQGYLHDPPQSLMNFVVRYRPDEQPSLMPHHDASTFTINLALNRVGIDYEGGGCRFIRYNCSVTGTKQGWMLMHPGRLTHYHEGLKTTKGTRYIMISFVDP